jgi:hemerythrin
MRMYEFPGFSLHQGDHEQVYHRLIRFMDDFDAGVLNSPALTAFLAGWLSEHSAVSDTEYVKWIHGRRAYGI